jgi:hypothetical protein
MVDCLQQVAYDLRCTPAVLSQIDEAWDTVCNASNTWHTFAIPVPMHTAEHDFDQLSDTTGLERWQ